MRDAAESVLDFDLNAIELVASTLEDIRAKGQKYTQGLPSPCMSVCQMNAGSGLCRGCLRTLNEITAWGNADERYKRQVWEAIGARVAALRTDLGDDFWGTEP